MTGMVMGSTYGSSIETTPAAFTPRAPPGDARAATAGGWHCRASAGARRPVTATDRRHASNPAAFAYARPADRPQTARIQRIQTSGSTWSRHSNTAGSGRPATAGMMVLTRSDVQRKETRYAAEVGTVRDLDAWHHASNAKGPPMGPPRWRIEGGPWLEYTPGGPYPRHVHKHNDDPRGKDRAPSTRDLPLEALLPKRAPEMDSLAAAAAALPAGTSDAEVQRTLRLGAEKERDAAQAQAEQLGNKLKFNEEAIKTMLASIAEMEAAIVDDSVQDAKRERILQEEQERVHGVTVRLHKAQSTLAMLQRKYGDEGKEQGDSGSDLRSQIMRLKGQVKFEQTEAHTYRKEMSRERKGRIVAEARVAELQRYIDADAEADRKREAQLVKLKAEAEADALEDARRAAEAAAQAEKLRAMEEDRKKDAEVDAQREVKLKQLEHHIEQDAAADAERERLIQDQDAQM